MQRIRIAFSGKSRVFEREKIPLYIHEFFYAKHTINEEHYEFFCTYKEIAKEYAGYFFITLHSALFSSSRYADCLIDVLRETKPNLYGSETKVQTEFYEDVYAFLKKTKNNKEKKFVGYMKNISTCGMAV